MGSNSKLYNSSETAVTLEPASIGDYPVIQNMARFYAYDLSKECQNLRESCHLQAEFKIFDFKNYLQV